jgi:hypothetical protein
MIEAGGKCKTSQRPKSLKEFFRSSFFWKPFFAVIAGGIAGFLFYYFVGCTSGKCAITNDPYGSVITGSILGFLFVSSPCASC